MLQTAQVAEHYCSWKGCFYIWLCPKHLEVLVALERQAQILGGPGKPNVISSLQMLPVIIFGPDQSLEWAIPRVRRDKVWTQDEIWQLQVPLTLSSCFRHATGWHTSAQAATGFLCCATSGNTFNFSVNAAWCITVKCRTSQALQWRAFGAVRHHGSPLQPGGSQPPRAEQETWGLGDQASTTSLRAVPRGRLTQEGALHLPVSPAQQKIEKNKETKLQGIGAG